MKSGNKLLVFPSWRDNPYLNLLSLAARADGWQLQESTTYEGLLDRAALLQDGDIIHVHWTNPIAQPAGNQAEAERRVRTVRGLLESLQGRGVRLIWTVHNRLPHELAFRETEIELYRLLAERADAVHVMSESTADVISDICTLDSERMRIIPHPSYRGVYDSGIGYAAARASFDLADDELGVLFLGQLRPYKGINVLLEAVGIATERSDGRRPVLLLAGKASDQERAEIESTLPSGVRSVVHFGFVPDGDIARWFTAADLAVFPYRAILNSGSVHLAASFQTPVILPGEDHLKRQYAKQSWVHLYDPDRAAEAIAEALSDAELFHHVSAADFEAFTKPISPWRISREYCKLLDGLPHRTFSHRG